MKRMVVVLFFLSASIATAQRWETDLDIAFSEARLQNMPVLLFFTVPDACDACSELENTIFKSSTFIDRASQKYILTRIEFSFSPGQSMSADQKAKNLLIVEKYNKDGFFPLVVLLSKTGQVLGKIGVHDYDTPEKYLAALNSFESN